MPATPPRGVPFPTPMPGYSGTNESQFRRMLETRLRDLQAQVDADEGGGGGGSLVRSIWGSFERPDGEIQNNITSVPILASHAGTITGWTITGRFGETGDATFDVLKNGVSIVAAAPPVLVGGNSASSTTLTGWDIAYDAGDAFAFNTTAINTFSQITITLQCEETI